MGNPEKPIPRETAKELCQSIYEENKKKIFSIAKWQCWGCMTFTKGDETKMCYANHEQNRGCNLVNKRFDTAKA